MSTNYHKTLMEDRIPMSEEELTAARELQQDFSGVRRPETSNITTSI